MTKFGRSANEGGGGQSFILAVEICKKRLLTFLNSSNSAEKSRRLSLMGSEILDFGSHYSAKFQPILDILYHN